MNTNPIVVPVFAVEESIKAIKIALATAGHPAPVTQRALEVLEQLLKEGPVPMPAEAYHALYDMLASDPQACRVIELRPRAKQYQD